MKFSSKVMALQPSSTVAIMNKAKELTATGENIISFCVGEPDFLSPSAANEEAIQAIKRGESHYTNTAGITALREAIRIYYMHRFDMEYPISDIVIGAGAKPLLYQAFQILLDDDDEVLLFSPAWVSYAEQIKLAGGNPVFIDTINTGLVPTRDMIVSAISSKTVGMIINTPNNPTGMIYDSETLKIIADVAREYGLWVINDEIYEQLVYEGRKHINLLQIAPDLRGQVITVNGFSKTYAMTGWRIGYALGPSDFIQKLNMLQGHLTSSVCSIAQWAAVGAMQRASADVIKMREQFQKRRDIMYGLISQLPLITAQKPEGAFYIFADISRCPLPDDVAFCKALLEEAKVAVVPGSAFFAPGYIRFSYSCSEETIRKGMYRIKNFLSQM